MTDTKGRQVTADLLLLLVTLIWGSTFVLVKDAVAAYPVFPFLALRFGFATLILFVIGWKRLASLGWRGLGAGVLIGCSLCAGYAFQTLGLQHTSASKAGFITGLSVAIVPVLSALLLRRLPTTESIAGVCLATIGLALLTLERHMQLARGDVLVLVCALSFALHIVSVSVFAPKSDPIALTTVQVLTVAVVCGTISLFTNRPWPSPRPSIWFAAGFTSVLASAVAFGIQTTVQRFTTPTHTALIFAAEPVFAGIFGVLLANEMMTARSVVGGVLIVAGTVASEIHWSERTAAMISRFLRPRYVAAPLLLVLGLADPLSWRRGLLWAIGMGLVALACPLVILTRGSRKGGIGGSQASRRREHLRPGPVMAAVTASGIPLLILFVFDGPKLLLLAFSSAFVVVVCNLLISFRWRISPHVSSIAATTTLVTALMGIGASPLLLLIPLVAWARVKVGAHTVMQTVAGGLVGVTVTIIVLLLCRIA